MSATDMAEAEKVQEMLPEIARALDVLAKNACVYVGPRMRRITSITAMKTLKIQYEDGKVEHVAPWLIRRFVICVHEPKDLGKVAEALDALAKYAYLYGGPRRRRHRVVAVSAERTLHVKYEDGDQYIAPQLKRYFVVYLAEPKNA
jgi:hypothetical protein